MLITGIGPGSKKAVTAEAKEAVLGSDVVVGYTSYIGLLKPWIGEKELVSFGMRKEIERAQYAIDRARRGESVCLVSGGDPGVYGIAGLALELMSEEDRDTIDVRVIPGVTAAHACASLLGAPLGHDFAVISLSDLLTPRAIIKKRLSSALSADFVLVLYNPKGEHRRDLFAYALDAASKFRTPETPVGIVRRAFRDGEDVRIVPLERISEYPVDMNTTLVFGNSRTFVRGPWMITPRGFKDAYPAKFSQLD